MRGRRAGFPRWLCRRSRRMANPMFGSRRAAAHRDRGARGLLSAIPVTEYVLFCLAEVRCRRPAGTGVAGADGVGERRGRTAGRGLLRHLLNRAARVMAAGHGGQILRAASTAVLLTASTWWIWAATTARPTDAGGVFQVRAPALRTDFPPLRALDVTPGNLRSATTSLIGANPKSRRWKRFCGRIGW
jgi:hypothetical protein